ncbi:DUF1566 domain-containing protein [Leptospira sp. WS92.C1]
MRIKHFFKTFLLLFYFAFGGCKEKPLDNSCSPESKSHWEAVILSAASSNLIPYCGADPNAPRALSYPSPSAFANGVPFSLTPTVIGNGITFSILPALPNGLALDSQTGTISGSYIGYSGVDTVFTVTASNANGFVLGFLELILSGPLPLKTGQTICYDSVGNPISCAGTGQDGLFQNGRNASFSGPTLVNGTDYTTTDHFSGLIWKSCSEGQTGAACVGIPNDFDWVAGNAACTNLNGIPYANRTDWRLASAKELSTIVHYDGNSPATYPGPFPNTSGSGYWSSSLYAPIVGDSWYVSFTDGIIGETIQANANKVHCVSGSQLPAPLFRDNGDSTVTDVNTGLVWTQCPAGLTGFGCSAGVASSVNWTNALIGCNSLNLSGRVWRLPSVNELQSITDISGTFPVSNINSSFFPNTPAANFWTSTSYTNPADAWVLQFGIGNVVMNLTKGAIANVRCVATGP